MRPVGWKNWDEWLHVYNLLFSEDEQEILKGCAKVSAWLSKQQVPIAIEVTAALQKELHNNKRNVDALSLGIIRFINGVIEPYKDANISSSIQTICNELNVPDHVLNIRHAATHGQIPTFEFACVGALSALKWLRDNYWEQQLNVLKNIRNEARNEIISYFNGSGNDPINKAKKYHVFSFFVPELIDFILDHEIQQHGQMLVNLISSKTDVFPSLGPAITASILTEYRSGNTNAESWFNFLNPHFPVEEELLNWNPSESSNYPSWPKTSIGNLPIQTADDLTLDDSEVDFIDDLLT